MLVEYKKTIDKEEIKLYPPFVFSGEVIVVDDPQQVNQAVNDLSKHGLRRVRHRNQTFFPKRGSESG